MNNLLNYSFKELKNYFVEKELQPRFAYQIFNWIYRKFEFDINQMSDLSKKFREELIENDKIISLKIKETMKMNNSVKFLFEAEDGIMTESVLIIADEGSSNPRYTLCISCQSGCPLDCQFCATGKMGFFRNLETHEIVSQILIAEKHLIDQGLSLKSPEHKNQRSISNVVFMGMGEPLLNPENVYRTIDILNFNGGYHLGHRHITISTVGIIPEIPNFAEKYPQVRLAVSLHASTQDKRKLIMPVARKYALKDLIKVLNDYQNGPVERRITFEYILIQGVNDFEEDVINLKRLLTGIKYNLNVIPYNPIDSAPFKVPTTNEIRIFENFLKKHGIPYVIRRSKGDQIQAGCGQLGLSALKK